MKRRLSLALALLAGCATADVSNLAAYCTPENAFLLGTQSRAYFGVCPKETEAAFLAGLERGRAYRPNTPSVYPYIEQMRTLERQLVATSSDAERQPLRARLTDVEWWAIHLMSAPGSYGEGH